MPKLKEAVGVHLVQPLAQSRASTEIRLSFLEIWLEAAVDGKRL